MCQPTLVWTNSTYNGDSALGCFKKDWQKFKEQKKVIAKEKEGVGERKKWLQLTGKNKCIKTNKKDIQSEMTIPSNLAKY